MLQIPGGHADQPRIGQLYAPPHVQQPQLLGVLEQSLYPVVVQRPSRGGLVVLQSGYRQLLQHLEAGRARLLREPDGRQPDLAVGYSQHAQLRTADLELLHVQEGLGVGERSDVGYVQKLQIRAVGLEDWINCMFSS